MVIPPGKEKESMLVFKKKKVPTMLDCGVLDGFATVGRTECRLIVSGFNEAVKESLQNSWVIVTLDNLLFNLVFIRLDDEHT